MSVQNRGKIAVSVGEMARMVNLSRARFYQLIGTAFPHPVYDVSSRRPCYTEELQRACLEVRRRNCGIDGRPVLFNARRSANKAPSNSRERESGEQAGLLDAVKSLGLTTATAADVRAAVRELFPAGVEGVDEGDMIRAVFLLLKRSGPADTYG